MLMTSRLCGYLYGGLFASLSLREPQGADIVIELEFVFFFLSSFEGGFVLTYTYESVCYVGLMLGIGIVYGLYTG